MFPDNFSKTNKNDVLIYLLKLVENTSIFHEKVFLHTFPELYNELNKIQFPKDFTFSMKLYHFLHNDLNLTLGRCVVCGNRCKYKNFKIGYSPHCSRQCMSKDEKYILKQKESSKNMPEETKKIKSQKIKEHIYNRTDEEIEEIKRKYRKTWFSKSQEERDEINKRNSEIQKQINKDITTKEKERRSQLIKNSWKNKSDEEKQLKKIREFETKKKNGTMKSSKCEDALANFLKDQNINYYRNYCKDIRYPYHCDFYLYDYDVFIEINGHPSHGKHPFDNNNIDDLLLLEKWRQKNTKFYNKCIEIWTKHDVDKRIVAKTNNIKYIEIFSCDIKEVINKVKSYINIK